MLSSAPKKLPSARTRVNYSLFHSFVISYWSLFKQSLGPHGNRFSARFRRRYFSATLNNSYPGPRCFLSLRRETERKERKRKKWRDDSSCSGRCESYYLATIGVKRLINMQLITAHLSIKIKQLPEVFSRRFFHSLLSSRGKKTSGTRVSNRQNIRLFPQANKSQLY